MVAKSCLEKIAKISSRYNVPGTGNTVACVYSAFQASPIKHTYASLSCFDRANTGHIVKFNLRTEAEDALIPVSGFQARKNWYRWTGYSGMDLAVDEQGLWVLWGEPSGNFRLRASKIDVYKNVIVQTWSLNTGKNSTSVSFIVIVLIN